MVSDEQDPRDGQASATAPAANKHLLVVFHSATGGVETMAEAVLEGARDPAIDHVDIRARRALDAHTDDVLWADGIILGTPENFGYMSGALKHFFDTVYYPCLDLTRGRPFALFVNGNTDGTGAVRAIHRIVTGLGWREVRPPIVVVGAVDPADIEQCRELGAAMAAGLSFELL